MSTEMPTKVEDLSIERTTGPPWRLPRQCSREIWQCAWTCTQKCARYRPKPPQSQISHKTRPCTEIQEGRKKPKDKVFGQDVPGTSGTRTPGYPDKNFMQVAFVCCFRQGVARMSQDLGRDVPDVAKFYARKLWADFSFPRNPSGIPTEYTLRLLIELQWVTRISQNFPEFAQICLKFLGEEFTRSATVCVCCVFSAMSNSAIQSETWPVRPPLPAI